MIGRLWQYYKKLWKDIETGRIFSFYDYLLVYMTWRCPKTFKNVFFQYVSAQCLIYIKA